jgi:hypothetical protein
MKEMRRRGANAGKLLLLLLLFLVRCGGGLLQLLLLGPQDFIVPLQQVLCAVYAFAERIELRVKYINLLVMIINK